MLYSLPSVLVLILVYLRLRAALQMDALLIRERATAETFRLLYEASHPTYNPAYLQPYLPITLPLPLTLTLTLTCIGYTGDLRALVQRR